MWQGYIRPKEMWKEGYKIIKKGMSLRDINNNMEDIMLKHLC